MKTHCVLCNGKGYLYMLDTLGEMVEDYPCPNCHEAY